ncbi:MAG TPA: tryptophan halogenase family protein [Steroidobacteraceae bacterium]|nr:tryptophan halogenase family protein [Steroidobacteraceae bacterium]
MSERFSITILGGGTAGWMAAAAFATRLPREHYAISLVESDEISTVGVGEATLPHLKVFNELIGVEEARFMQATRATFKLGIEFRDWNRPGDAYLHPFGAFGEPWGGIEFQHHWMRLRSSARPVRPIGEYSFSVSAARACLFGFPSPDARSPQSTFSYAYHLDAGLYAAMLRQWGEAHGVRRHEGRVQGIARDGATGHVRHLQLVSGERIEGDLFIDCSGFRSLLVGEELGVAWQDWAEWLPCDRAWAVPCARQGPLTPNTRSTAALAGWKWRIPLQHRVGNGYVYSSRWMADEQARDSLLDSLESRPLSEPRLLRFRAGRRVRAWEGNCVAIGLAGGFLEPLESTSIFLIQAGVTDLLRLMPRPGPQPFDERLREEFNRLTDLQYERIRDFLVLHYAANERVGEPLWDHVRTMPLPDSLRHKIALFRSRAVLPNYQYGLFSRDSWLAVLWGQGIEPHGYSPLADALPVDTMQQQLEQYAHGIRTGLDGLQGHEEFVRRYCNIAKEVA